MGVGTGRRGSVIVTDMDTIETSNLSRQFLFRSTDVGNSKSVSGARVVKGWNPDMRVEGIEKFCGPSTEDYFTDDFWEGLDLCWNALDNVKARQYTDGRCLWFLPASAAPSTHPKLFLTSLKLLQIRFISGLTPTQACFEWAGYPTYEGCWGHGGGGRAQSLYATPPSPPPPPLPPPGFER